MKLDVLIVGDRDQERVRFVQILEMSGLRIWASSSYDDALELMRVERPMVLLVDLGLSDIDRPETDGLEFISQARAAYPTMKILAISGDGTSIGSDLLRARAMGADAAIPKSVSPEKLVELVGHIMECAYE